MAEHDIGITRRDVLIGGASGLMLAAANAGPALAQAATVTGIVFEDRDGSGVAGPANPGLTGALVSNGRDVAVTGADGRYTLPLPDEATISWSSRRASCRRSIPRPICRAFIATISRRARRPPSISSSRDRPDRAAARLGGLPSETPGRAEGVRRRAHHRSAAGDGGRGRIHPRGPDRRARRRKAKFGLTAGDVMFDELSLYPRYNAIIGTIGLPWWNIGGNHDLNFDAPNRKYSRETFKRVFGPNCYAFFYGPTLFLMLDNVDYLGPDPTKPRGSGKYEGRFDEAQLDFVRNVLAHTPDDTLIVAVMHIPIRTILGTEAYQNTANKDAFFKLIEGRKHTVSFSGHTHTTEHHYFGKDDGWTGETPHHHHVLTALSGSWWSGPFDHRGVASADSRDGTPNGFHILSVDGTDYTTRFVPAKEPNGRQMRLSLDSRFHGISKEADHEFRQVQLLGSPVPRAALGSSTLIANVFDAGEKTKVTFRIGDRRRSRWSATPARSVRRGSVRPQRGDQEGLGQGRDLVARLDRAPADRPCAGRLPDRGRGGQRIRQGRDWSPGARGHGLIHRAGTAMEHPKQGDWARLRGSSRPRCFTV